MGLVSRVVRQKGFLLGKPYNKGEYRCPEYNL